jgi:hypothetical protein
MNWKETVRTVRHWAGVALLAGAASGCATYGEGVQKALDQTERGQYQQAEKLLAKELDPSGDDRLLYFTETGTLKHLTGDLQESNKRLDEAERIAEDLYTKRMDEMLSSLMSNPRNSDYAGTDYEKVYINYYKALNYLFLAQQAKSEAERRDHLQSARVESRKVTIQLDAYAAEKGNYKEVKDKEKQTFSKLLDIYNKFSGNWLDADWLVFRDDAYARYLTGLLYEMRGEWDDARIAYETAAKMYAEGYNEQYKLDAAMGEQALIDAVRMMEVSGGYGTEIDHTLRTKFSASMKERLRAQQSKDAQLVVIQHMGLMPARDEMSLHLTMNPSLQQLKLEPVLTGDEEEREDKMSWFFLLYADKGVMSLIDGYTQGGLAGVADKLTSKTISLGPAWQLAESIRLPQAIGNTGLRVTVPYYRPFDKPFRGSRVSVDGSGREMLRSENLYRVALQEQLRNAGSDLNGALARASLKNILAGEVGEALGGGLGRLAGKLTATASSAAETRNWLTLPYEIRVRRIPVEPGEHQVTLTTTRRDGSVVRERHTVQVEAGETYVLRERTNAREGKPAKKADNSSNTEATEQAAADNHHTQEG